MNDCDVVVVGAGPAGSLTAALLARQGYSVVLLDRAVFPRDKACAEYCSPGVQAVLSRAGVWPQLAGEALRVPGMMLWLDGDPVLRIRYGSLDQPRPAFTLPRWNLDLALIRHASASGVDVREGVRAMDVETVSSHIRVKTGSKGSMSDQLKCKVVVGADGLHSTVSQSLGIESRGQWPRRLGLVTHYEGVSDLGSYGEMHVGPGVYCGLAPLPGGRVNVGLVMSLTSRANSTKHVADRFREAIQTMPQVQRKLSAGRMVKPIRGMGPMSRRVESLSGNGYLLVGDAAGFLDPFTGEGIYRGLRGAEIASGVIHDALSNDALGPSRDGPPDLSAYRSIRRREFIAKERLTWLVQLALTRPAVLARLCRGVATSPDTAWALGNALGDCSSAAELLDPRKMTRLLLAAAGISPARAILDAASNANG